MNSRPMILRFSSGSLTPASASRNCFWASTTCRVDAGGGDEVALDLLGLALAQQAVVDEDAGQPVADRALDDRRGDGGVDAAGQPADGAAVLADLLADPLDLLLDDVDHRPGLAAAGDLVQEVLEHALAVLGVQHLGVPLDAGQPAVEVLERRDRGGVGRGQHLEARRAPPRPSRRGTSRRCGRPGRSASRTPGSPTRTWVRPYSRAPVWATSPPSARAISWKP